MESGLDSLHTAHVERGDMLDWPICEGRPVELSIGDCSGMNENDVFIAGTGWDWSSGGKGECVGLRVENHGFLLLR